jgi:hypothetical protein
MQKVLNARWSRVRRLARATLRYIRANGVDQKATYLRQQFEAAVAKLADLAYHPNADTHIIATIRNIKLGLTGYTDQIEASLQSKMS